MRTYSVSQTGLTIVVSEKNYDEFGFPLPGNKTGLIRPQAGSDLHKLVAILESGKGPNFAWGVQGSNGLYEMEAVKSTVKADTIEQA